MKITKNKVLIFCLVLIVFLAGFSGIKYFGSKKKSQKKSKSEDSYLNKSQSNNTDSSQTENNNIFSEILRNTENIPEQSEIQEIRLRYHDINEKARNLSIRILNMIRMLKFF